MPGICFVNECKTNILSIKLLRSENFFRFPQDFNLQNQWYHLLDIDPEDSPLKPSSLLCAKHFRPDDIRQFINNQCTNISVLPTDIYPIGKFEKKDTVPKCIIVTKSPNEDHEYSLSCRLLPNENKYYPTNDDASLQQSSEYDENLIPKEELVDDIQLDSLLGKSAEDEIESMEVEADFSFKPIKLSKCLNSISTADQIQINDVRTVDPLVDEIKEIKTEEIDEEPLYDSEQQNPEEPNLTMPIEQPTPASFPYPVNIISVNPLSKKQVQNPNLSSNSKPFNQTIQNNLSPLCNVKTKQQTPEIGPQTVKFTTNPKINKISLSEKDKLKNAVIFSRCSTSKINKSNDITNKTANFKVPTNPALKQCCRMALMKSDRQFGTAKNRLIVDKYPKLMSDKRNLELSISKLHNKLEELKLACKKKDAVIADLNYRLKKNKYCVL